MNKFEVSLRHEARALQKLVPTEGHSHDQSFEPIDTSKKNMRTFLNSQINKLNLRK